MAEAPALEAAERSRGRFRVETTMDEDAAELARRVAELSHLLLTNETLDSALRRAADLALAVIPHCDCCGVSVVTEAGVRTGVATSPTARRLDKEQDDADDGPCLAAIRERVVVKVEDAATDGRWPRFGAAAKAEGVTSSLSVPLLVNHTTVGALNLYSATGPFGDRDDRAAAQLAHHASVALANVHAYHASQELVGQLHVALESRDLIGQAKGIVMERERCTAERAFEVLRSASQRRHVKLRDVAQQVVDTGTWADAPA